MKNIAIILAGGSGSRFNQSTPKQFLYLDDRRIIDYSISTFINHKDIDDIIIVCHNKWKKIMESEYPDYKVVIGGSTRQKSVLKGLESCSLSTLNVFIHDAARPFISKKNISQSIKLLKTYKAVNISVPAIDTTIIVQDNIISSTLNRNNIYLSQTPQSFRYKTILNAHQSSNEINLTDDIQMINNLGIDCYNLEGDANNIKITYSKDLDVAMLILKNKMKEMI